MLCYDSELKQAITRTKMRKNRIRTDAFEIQQKASYSNFKLHCMLVKRTLYLSKRSISHYKKTNTAHFLNLRGDFAETAPWQKYWRPVHKCDSPKSPHLSLSE